MDDPNRTEVVDDGVDADAGLTASLQSLAEAETPSTETPAQIEERQERGPDATVPPVIKPGAQKPADTTSAPTPKPTDTKATKPVEAPKTDPTKPLTRGEQRIRESVEKAKQAEERARVAEEKLSKLSPPNPDAPKPGPRVLVEKPKPPQYSREQLSNTKKALAAKVKAGEATEKDSDMLEYVTDELQAWDKYDTKLELWEVKNGQAVKQYDAAKVHYKGIAADKWPEMKDPNSHTFKTAQNIEAKIDEMMTGPARDYYIAEVAAMIVRGRGFDSEVGALKTENTQLKEHIAKLEKKLAPMEAGDGAPVAGSESSDASDDPDKFLAQGMRQIRQSRAN